MTREDWRWDFADEEDRSDEFQLPKTCGECREFKRCPYPQHEQVGWCDKWDEWAMFDDERCDCEWMLDEDERYCRNAVV